MMGLRADLRLVLIAEQKGENQTQEQHISGKRKPDSGPVDGLVVGKVVNHPAAGFTADKCT